MGAGALGRKKKKKKRILFRFKDNLSLCFLSISEGSVPRGSAAGRSLVPFSCQSFWQGDQRAPCCAAEAVRQPVGSCHDIMGLLCQHHRGRGRGRTEPGSPAPDRDSDFPSPHHRHAPPGPDFFLRGSAAMAARPWLQGSWCQTGGGGLRGFRTAFFHLK